MKVQAAQYWGLGETGNLLFLQINVFSPPSPTALFQSLERKGPWGQLFQKSCCFLMFLVVSVFLSLSTCLAAPGYQALAIGWREHQQVGSCGQQGEETEAAAALKARGYAQTLCSGVGESRPAAGSEGHSGVLHENVSTRRHCKKTACDVWHFNHEY